MIHYLLMALLAVQTLDVDMSAQDRKATGVYKLSDKQKKALQEWIDANYEKRETPLATATQDGATLQENLHSGKYIRLSDNSTWEIHPDDTAITQSWITPVEIIPSQSGDPQYPYKLTNSLTGSSVRARSVKKVPNT